METKEEKKDKKGTLIVVLSMLLLVAYGGYYIYDTIESSPCPEEDEVAMWLRKPLDERPEGWYKEPRVDWSSVVDRYFDREKKHLEGTLHDFAADSVGRRMMSTLGSGAETSELMWQLFYDYGHKSYWNTMEPGTDWAGVSIMKGDSLDVFARILRRWGYVGEERSRIGLGGTSYLLKINRVEVDPVTGKVNTGNWDIKNYKDEFGDEIPGHGFAYIRQEGEDDFFLNMQIDDESIDMYTGRNSFRTLENTREIRIRYSYEWDDTPKVASFTNFYTYSKGIMIPEGDDYLRFLRIIGDYANVEISFIQSEGRPYLLKNKSNCFRAASAAVSIAAFGYPAQVDLDYIARLLRK